MATLIQLGNTNKTCQHKCKFAKQIQKKRNLFFGRLRFSVKKSFWARKKFGYKKNLDKKKGSANFAQRKFRRK